MHGFPLSLTRAVLLAVAMSSAAPCAAQDRGADDATLAARMRAFLREVPRSPNTGLVEFFPRRADWTWQQTLSDERGRPHGTGLWRFGGAETPRVVADGGPACLSFDEVHGEVGPWEGLFGMQANRVRGPWRRVRGTRFVPPGAPASSPVFVEWQREDGRWVVAAYGDEDIYFPRVLGRRAGLFSPDTSLVPEDAAFAPAEWYTVALGGRRYSQYGSPRPLDRDGIERIGVLGRVSIYVPRGEGSWPRGFFYLPVAPGRYQPYEGPFAEPCR